MENFRHFENLPDYTESPRQLWIKEATVDIVRILKELKIECTPEEVDLIQNELSSYNLKTFKNRKEKDKFITDAYRVLAQAFHPDTGVLLRDNEEMIKSNNAHDIAIGKENNIPPDPQFLYNQLLKLSTVWHIIKNHDKTTPTQSVEQSLETIDEKQINGRENNPLALPKLANENAPEIESEESDASELLDRFSGMPPKEPDDIEEEGINRPDLSNLPNPEDLED